VAPSNLIYSILEKNLVSGRLGPGEEIGVRADQMLIQDGTGTMVFLHLGLLNQSRVKNRFAICYVDHNTLGDGPENAEDHRFLRSACAKYKLHYSRAGNGIGHQVHLERFAKPGALLLGADSHVPTLGGAGMLAIGTGGVELAAALTGAPHYFDCPRVMQVTLRSKLKPWVTAKDVILHIIGLLADKDTVGLALEYTGPGVASLSVPQRATITNMGAELGLTSSIFPSDARTRTFFNAQGRGKDAKLFKPAKTAEYHEFLEVDLSKVVPMVALPHSPLNVKPVREVAGQKLDQVAVGSCTNGSYEDLVPVALCLRKRKVHSKVDMIVAPATRQVFQTMLAKGYIADLSQAGCRLAESACGFCIGHGHAPARGSVSLRTSNRNYRGRSGTADAEVYLASPLTAAASALRGEICDPRDLKRPAPRFTAPKRYVIDDSLIEKPPKAARKPVELLRGPDIMDPPNPGPLPASLNAEVLICLGDDISTDDILPAGRWLKHRSNVPEYAKHVFANHAPNFATRALENKEREIANIVVAGERYGQGSSREHAAMCPLHLGVRVVVAKSFERIHFANLINHGVVPLRFLDDHSYDRIREDDYLEFPWIARELRKSETVSLRNTDTGVEFKVKHGLTRRQIAIVLAGGLRNYIAERPNS